MRLVQIPKWSIHDAENRDEPTNQIQWIDLPKQNPIEPDNKNTIIWKEVDESRQHDKSKEIIWEPLTEEESKFTDEQIEEGLPEVKVTPSLLQALDRSIAFEDGFVGPDISLNIPNGLRWSISHKGSASISGSGGNKSTIIHTNILQTRSWSFGLNTSIISSNNTQSGISSNYKPVREISSGFRVAKKINDTAGIAFGGEQAVQWDDKNINSKNYLMATGWWLSQG